MGFRKTAKNMKEIVQGASLDLGHMVKETWDNLIRSPKAKSSLAAAGYFFGISGGLYATAKIGYKILGPSITMAAEAEEEIQGPLCGLEQGVDSIIRDRVLHSKKYSFLLNVKKGETVEEAIRAYATIYSDPLQQEAVILESFKFVEGMRYKRTTRFRADCVLPLCISVEGCDPVRLLELAQNPLPPPAELEEALNPEAPATAETAIPVPPATPEAPVPGLPAEMPEFYKTDPFINFLWDAKITNRTDDYVNSNYSKYPVKKTDYNYETALGINAIGAKKRKMSVFSVGNGYANSGERIAEVRYDSNGRILDINELGDVQGRGAGRDMGKATPFYVSNWGVEGGQGRVNGETIAKTLAWLLAIGLGAYGASQSHGGGGSTPPYQPVNPPVQQPPPPVQPPPPGPLPGN